jgi:hypothetical protein
MEVPHLVRERLGDESVEATVNLGDEDVVCVTPTRTLVYRGEGLLSDESVAVFSHDVEQFDVSEGRRKTKFLFEYVDGADSFTVPGARAETVRKLLLGGILHVAGVTEDGESISDVFSFSELTLVVTSDRLVKHVGAPVWNDDFEEYPFADVTGLTFEEGSVATQVVLSVDGRPERIKAPSDEAGRVRRTLEQALFAFHDVGSLSALNETLGGEPSDTGNGDGGDASGSLALDEGISPLVDDEPADGSGTPAGPDGAAGATATGSAREPESRSGTATDRAPDAAADRGSSTPGDRRSDTGTDRRSGATPADEQDRPGGSTVDTVSTSSGPAPGSAASPGVDPEDVEAMKRQLSTLTEAVKKQNALLRDQQETIDTLIEELRRGR